MLYALIENGVIAQFPYTQRQWRRDNPLISMRAWEDCPPERLAEIGVVQVVELEQPAFDRRTHQADRPALPELVDGVWTWGWVISPKTQAQIDAYDADIRRRIEREADRRIDLLAPPRERERRMALSVLLIEKGKPAWTGADQAVADANRAVWAAIEAIRTRQAELQAMDPPPYPETLTDADWPSPPL